MTSLNNLKLLSEWAGCPEFGPEEYKEMEGVPAFVVEMLFKSQTDAWTKYQVEVEVEAKAKAVWSDYINDTEWAPEPITVLKTLGAQPKANKVDGVSQNGIWFPAKYKGLLELALGGVKDKIESEFKASLKPVTTTKVKSGVRAKFNGIEVEGKSKQDALMEGKVDGKFAFKGDENSTIRKDVISKDRTKKTINYKAVVCGRYMGGALSIPTDKLCNGAVAWECAGGSEALKATSMSSSQFKIRCGSKKLGNGYCSKCDGKAFDFFSNTYTITKGNALKHSGTTYKDFIVNNLEYLK